MGKEKPSFMLFKIFLNVEKGSPIFCTVKITDLISVKFKINVHIWNYPLILESFLLLNEQLHLKHSFQNGRGDSSYGNTTSQKSTSLLL